MRRYWLFGALLLSIALAILNLFALAGFWYWKYRWIDIPMHILGSAAIGAFLIGLSPKFRPLAYVAALVFFSIGWEVIEYFGGLTRYEQAYAFDTTHDLLNDAIGATIAYLGARFTIWRSN